MALIWRAGRGDGGGGMGGWGWGYGCGHFLGFKVFRRNVA